MSLDSLEPYLFRYLSTFFRVVDKVKCSRTCKRLHILLEKPLKLWKLRTCFASGEAERIPMIIHNNLELWNLVFDKDLYTGADERIIAIFFNSTHFLEKFKNHKLPYSAVAICATVSTSIPTLYDFRIPIFLKKLKESNPKGDDMEIIYRIKRKSGQEKDQIANSLSLKNLLSVDRSNTTSSLNDVIYLLLDGANPGNAIPYPTLELSLSHIYQSIEYLRPYLDKLYVYPPFSERLTNKFWISLLKYSKSWRMSHHYPELKRIVISSKSEEEKLNQIVCILSAFKYYYCDIETIIQTEEIRHIADICRILENYTSLDIKGCHDCLRKYYPRFFNPDDYKFLFYQGLHSKNIGLMEFSLMIQKDYRPDTNEIQVIMNSRRNYHYLRIFMEAGIVGLHEIISSLPYGINRDFYLYCYNLHH